MFKELFIEDEGGKPAGTMEIARTPLNKAREYAQKIFKEAGYNLNKELPDFDNNYIKAQKRAKLGHTKRNQMPVITSRDVELFKKRLEQGYIDIRDPRSNIKIGTGPFPDGLKGEEAKQWLQNGLKKFDGSTKDDKITIKEKNIEVDELKPIQEQMYFDKVIKKRAQEGGKKSLDFIRSSYLITSSDHYILDGNHRFLSAMLSDPATKVNILAIDLPIKTLLPMMLSYSDAIGNTRNK